ncbi:MAG: dihydrolipoamide acetyltransferase family protein [Deferrisomatales bacterium]
MPVDVTMPKLTDSMEEGRIVAWQVKAGDGVAVGDVLAEIETDKAVMELESFWSGSVAEIVRGAGDVVAVGEVIARIGEAGEAPAADSKPEPMPGQEQEQGAAGERAGEPAPAPEKARPEKAPPAGAAPAGGEPPEVPLPGAHPLAERGGVRSPRPAPPVPPRAEGVRASPRARKLAREKGLDLAAVEGSGPGGRVTTEDVERAAEPPPSREAGTARPPVPAPPDRADEELPPVSFTPEEAEEEAVSFYQKAVIRRVVASKHVIPHFYVTQAVRADALLARWRAEKEKLGATLTHYLLRACALALDALPEANRSYDRGRWIRWKVIHLGLAVQTEAGLVVAVLRDARGKDVAWIAENTRRLVEKARAGKLPPAERANPTFTLSNLGAFDVESFAAIINPPSALTLAVGSAVEAPVVEDGRVVPGTVMRLTLSCDHRVVDGVLAAKFLGEVKRLLEGPEAL